MKNFIKFMSIHLISSFLGAILISSCSLISHGPNQDVQVVTDPVGAYIYDGKDTIETPTTLNLKREKDHTIIISKAGYEIEKVEVKRKVNPKVAGNILMPLGVVCMAIDASSGAMWDLDPGIVTINLRPIKKPWFNELKSKITKIFATYYSFENHEDDHDAMKNITFFFLRDAKKVIGI